MKADKSPSIHEVIDLMCNQADRGERGKAAQSYRLALELAVAVYGRNDALVCVVWTWMAICCERKGRLTDAEAFNRKLRQRVILRGQSLITSRPCFIAPQVVADMAC